MFTLDEINEKLIGYRDEDYNIPGTVHYDSKPPDVRWVINEVIINSNPSGDMAEVFQLVGDRYSFTSLGVEKFRVAADIHFKGTGLFDNPLDYAIENSGNQDIVRIKVVAERLNPHFGKVQEVSAFGQTSISDYKEMIHRRLIGEATEKAKAEGWKKNEIPKWAELKLNEYSVRLMDDVLQMAIAKAKFNCIAQFLGMKIGYTQEELSKPFIIVTATSTANEGIE